MRGLFGVNKDTHLQLGYDFASLEARIQGHHCKAYPELGGDELAETLLAEKPHDIHSRNALKLGISRDNAKSISYGLLYGAQAQKISKMLSIPMEDAEKLCQDYWDAVPSLKKLKENLENFWKSSGEKYIKALDGRLLTIRFSHAILNSLLQGGGSLVTKYTTLFTSQELEKNGLLGDVLKDSFEDYPNKVYQLIIYHDEVQYAIPKTFYKPIFFDTEEEAKEYRKEHSLSMPVHFSEKRQKYYLDGVNPLYDIIQSSIREMEQFLELRTEIGFETITGRNWAECH